MHSPCYMTKVNPMYAYIYIYPPLNMAAAGFFLFLYRTNVLMHEAPAIHPVIHFQAIPDAINTASERRLIFHPAPTAQVGRTARICNALLVDVFRAACVYSADLFRTPLSQMSFIDVAGFV